MNCKSQTLPDGRVIVRATAWPMGDPPYGPVDVADGISQVLESMYLILPDGFYLKHLTVRRENPERGARHSMTAEFAKFPER